MLENDISSLACDSFILGLHSDFMQLQIKLRNPVSLTEALNSALSLESSLVTNSPSNQVRRIHNSPNQNLSQNFYPRPGPTCHTTPNGRTYQTTHNDSMYHSTYKSTPNGPRPNLAANNQMYYNPTPARTDYSHTQGGAYRPRASYAGSRPLTQN